MLYLEKVTIIIINNISVDSVMFSLIIMKLREYAAFLSFFGNFFYWTSSIFNNSKSQLLHPRFFQKHLLLVNI